MSGKKKAKAKKEALARLAASEVAALTNKSVELTADADKAASYKRITKAFDMPDDSLSDPEWATAVAALVEKMIKCMRGAALNINFPAHKFFAEKARPKYTSKFEVMRKTGAPMGDTRNVAEERMFNYSGFAGTDLASADPGHKAAALRAEDYGRIDSRNFAGAIRPKYCSMNFPALRDGMGAQWGKSHLVLAEHLKPNMTFIHSDSFDVVSGSKMTADSAKALMATYHHLHRLIVNMPDNMLSALIDAATGHLAKGLAWADFKKDYPLGSTAYIEGHVHGEIFMARDVKHIWVNYDEIMKLDDWQKKVEKFRSKCNVEIKFFR